LRAGDARHQLHREGGGTGVREGFERSILAVRVHDADDERALFETVEFTVAGAADFEDDVSVPDRVLSILSDGRASGFELGIRDAGLGSGAGLHHDVRTKALVFLHHVRRCRHAGLDRICLGENGDPHANSLKFVTVGGRVRPGHRS